MTRTRLQKINRENKGGNGMGLWIAVLTATSTKLDNR